MPGPQRYVILQHDHPHPHFDLMLEDGDHLRTWRLPEPPHEEKTSDAELSFAHRLQYLDYEGPVSGGRGSVQRWDAGQFAGDLQGEPPYQLRCQGERLHGWLRLELRDGNRWELTYDRET